MGGPDEKPAQLEFLTKLQRILGEGLFVASYKFAPGSNGVSREW